MLCYKKIFVGPAKLTLSQGAGNPTHATGLMGWMLRLVVGPSSKNLWPCHLHNIPLKKSAYDITHTQKMNHCNKTVFKTTE